MFVEAGQARWEAGPEGSWRHSSACAEVSPRIKAMKLDSGKIVLTSLFEAPLLLSAAASRL